jgi:hypothetical protein
MHGLMHSLKLSPIDLLIVSYLFLEEADQVKLLKLLQQEKKTIKRKNKKKNKRNKHQKNRHHLHHQFKNKPWIWEDYSTFDPIFKYGKINI